MFYGPDAIPDSNRRNTLGLNLSASTMTAAHDGASLPYLSWCQRY